MRKFIKFVGMMLFAIWFSGAMIMTIIYFYQAKTECVKSNGWLEGIFWCDSSTSEMEYFVKGLSWPFGIYSMVSNKFDENKFNPNSIVDEVRRTPENPRLLFVSAMAASIPVQANVADCVGFSHSPESSERLSSIKWSAKLNPNTTFEQCLNMSLAAWKAISDTFPSTKKEIPDGPALKYGDGPLFFPKNTYEYTKGFLNFGTIECSYNLKAGTIENLKIELVFERETALSEGDIKLISEASIFIQAMEEQGIKLCK